MEFICCGGMDYGRMKLLVKISDLDKYSDFVFESFKISLKSLFEFKSIFYSTITLSIFNSCNMVFLGSVFVSIIGGNIGWEFKEFKEFIN